MDQKTLTPNSEPSTARDPGGKILSVLAHKVRYAVGWVQGNPEVIGHAHVKALPEDPDQREYEDMVHLHI